MPAEFRESLQNYLQVPHALWDFIPIGAHIRYVKKDTGTADRYRPGGYLRAQVVSKDNRQIFILESVPNGSKNIPGYITFPLSRDNVEEIYKKYDKSAFIELYMITSSLAKKRDIIEQLCARVAALERANGI